MSTDTHNSPTTNQQEQKMTHQETTPTAFLYPDVPRYTYVLRKWAEDPRIDTASKVVVITDNTHLTREDLKIRFDQLEVGYAADFVLIDINPTCDVVLDTWERGIQGMYRTDTNWTGPARFFKNWWDANSCTEVETA
jgi:hypothetical protein